MKKTYTFLIIATLIIIAGCSQELPNTPPKPGEVQQENVAGMADINPNELWVDPAVSASIKEGTPAIFKAHEPNSATRNIHIQLHETFIWREAYLFYPTKEVPTSKDWKSRKIVLNKKIQNAVNSAGWIINATQNLSIEVQKTLYEINATESPYLAIYGCKTPTYCYENRWQILDIPGTIQPTCKKNEIMNTAGECEKLCWSIQGQFCANASKSNATFQAPKFGTKYYCPDNQDCLICAKGYEYENGNCIPEGFICKDTDDGNDIVNPGSAQLFKGEELYKEYHDRCITNASMREYFCGQQNEVEDEIVKCPWKEECMLDNDVAYCGKPVKAFPDAPPEPGN